MLIESIHIAPEEKFITDVLDLSGITNPKLEIDITNHRGIRATRIVQPLRRAMWFGSTPHHPEPQWFMHAWDIDKEAERDFAWKSIHSIKVIREEEES
jgi:predicted DNA-binding transcriptional regulator YafY